MIEGRLTAAVSSITVTVAPNTFPSNIRSASPKPGSSPRSAASATPTTTPSPKRSTASTKPRSFIVGGPWRNFEEVEFATLEWVDWFNNRRLLEPIGNIPPADNKRASF
jgi:putative transposase